ICVMFLFCAQSGAERVNNTREPSDEIRALAIVLIPKRSMMPIGFFAQAIPDETNITIPNASAARRNMADPPIGGFELEFYHSYRCGGHSLFAGAGFSRPRAPKAQVCSKRF